MVPEEEQLPFGLSHQLGQLIFGAAQYFNADSPNVDVNFFAPVFGGEEDFGFNPGDEDMWLMDSDSDSYMEDESVKEIFVSLADSHVIRRLSFHKNVDSVYKFPRLAPSEWPCYEEVYRLLEEVELLAKVWRRRLDHPYTAHISRVEGVADHAMREGSGEALREGEDYNSSDYEYDSEEDFEDFDQPPPGGVNENLTKKKYCQSIRVFNQIFDSTKQFDSFQRSVSKMKKYIFGIIFHLFLETLPSEIRFKIPQELWEKVWKFTQNSYFRYKTSVPLHKDETYYKSGLRASESRLMYLEKERVRDMFGAVGNLHMTLFEILFKNPCILQPSPMFELETKGGEEERFGRSVWKTNNQSVRTKFSRLQQLETVLDSGGADTQDKGEAVDLGKKMEAGTVLVHDVGLQLDQVPDMVDKVDPSAAVIVSHATCSKLALTGRYKLEGEEFGLLLFVISALTGKVEQVVLTGHSYQAHLMEVGRYRLRRKGAVGWKSQFCITEDRLTFLAWTENSGHLKVWSYSLQGTQVELSPLVTPPAPPLVDSVSTCPTFCSVMHNSSSVVLLAQWADTMTTLTIYCLETGEALLSLPWPGELLWLDGLSDTRALLRSSTSIQFLSLQAGEIIQTFSVSDLNKEFRVSEESWTCRLDTNPKISPQFLLFTQTLSAYKLFKFDPDLEMSRPAVLLSGRQLVEAVEGLGPNILLSRGCLVTNKFRELATPSSSETSQTWHTGQVRSHDLTSYTLHTRARHGLLCMSGEQQHVETVLNQVNFAWSDMPSGPQDPGPWNPEKRPVAMLTDNSVGILLEDCSKVRTVDFGLEVRQVGEREADNLVLEETKDKMNGSQIRTDVKRTV